MRISTILSLLTVSAVLFGCKPDERKRLDSLSAMKGCDISANGKVACRVWYPHLALSPNEYYGKVISTQGFLAIKSNQLALYYNPDDFYFGSAGSFIAIHFDTFLGEREKELLYGYVNVIGEFDAADEERTDLPIGTIRLIQPIIGASKIPSDLLETQISIDAYIEETKPDD